MDMNSQSDLSIFSDEHYMQRALEEAKLAFEANEVPIGAVVVCRNRIIGKGHNQVERLQDATAHAEMLALTAAADYLGNKYLDECTLFVTVEPCVMCAGALHWTKVKRIVFGASEPKFGFGRYGNGLLHPKAEIVGGVMAEACREMMRKFFLDRRGNK